MKQTLLLLLLFLSFTISAQVTLKITTPDSSVEVLATDDDVTAKGTIKNESADTVTLIWKRDSIKIPEGWETAVCDKNLCYVPAIEEMELVLAGGEESNFDVHVYPNMSSEGSAFVEVSVTDVNNPNNTVTGIYTFISKTTSTFSIKQPEIKIFPNPTINYISLSDTKFVERLIIYNIVGRQVKMFDSNFSNYYDVSNLPTGMYLVRLVGENDKILKTVRLSKKGGA